LRTLAKYIYNRADSIFMRSLESLRFLKELNVSNNIEGVFPDSTLLFEKSINNIPKEKYFILSPSAIMYNLHGEEYINVFISLVKCFSKTYKPVIVCHNFTANGSNSDLAICEKLSLAVAKYEPILYREEMLPSEYKGIFSKAIFCISSRYHVVVGSFSVGIPAIAIGWNHKYNEFLNLYGQGDLNMIFSDKTVNNVIKQVEKLESNEFLKESIKNYNLKLKGIVRDSFDKLKQKI